MNRLNKYLRTQSTSTLKGCLERYENSLISNSEDGQKIIKAIRDQIKANEKDTREFFKAFAV